MRKFNCKIELAEPFGDASIYEFEADGALRGALDWLMLAVRRDSISKNTGDCIELEHCQKEIVIRVNKNMAVEAAIGRRVS